MHWCKTLTLIKAMKWQSRLEKDDRVPEIGYDDCNTNMLQHALIVALCD